MPPEGGRDGGRGRDSDREGYARWAKRQTCGNGRDLNGEETRPFLERYSPGDYRVIRPGADWAGHVPGQYVRIGIDVDGVRHTVAATGPAAPLIYVIVSAVLVSSWSAVRKRAEILLRQARDDGLAACLVGVSEYFRYQGEPAVSP